MTPVEVEYHIAITRTAPGGRAVIEWGGYGHLHELLSDVMHKAAKAGWLSDWPELPPPHLLKPEV
jgi:hypothetical protein